MFGFLEEILKLTGLPFELLNNGFRIINFNNVSCYIEGYKNILDFSPECISIKLFKGIIKLCGKDLKIKNLNLNTVLIVGQINSVEQN